jgi:hypothetical protein
VGRIHFRTFVGILLFALGLSGFTIRQAAGPDVDPPPPPIPPQDIPYLWHVEYDGPEHKGEEAKWVAVDAAGYVYVAGDVERAAAGDAQNYTDILTMKISPSGQILWSHLYNHRKAPDLLSWESSRGIVVDANGFVYVTGEDLYSTQCAFYTLRYTPVGQLDWERCFPVYRPSDTDIQAGGISIDGTPCMSPAGAISRWSNTPWMGMRSGTAARRWEASFIEVDQNGLSI